MVLPGETDVLTETAYIAVPPNIQAPELDLSLPNRTLYYSCIGVFINNSHEIYNTMFVFSLNSNNNINYIISWVFYHRWLA